MARILLLFLFALSAHAALIISAPAAGFGLIGINSATASFTLDLGASYASAGVFMNYPRPVSGVGPSIVAIASDGITVLESYNIEISAPIITPNGANAGAFRGISRPSADIRFLQVANSFAAIHSITVDAPTAVPEPASFLLLAPALLYLLRRHNC